MQLINIGFGNLVSAQRLLAIVSPDSAPIKRLIQESRDRGMLIDATYGRKTAAVLIMDSDHVVLSALSTEKLAPRLGLTVEDFKEHMDLFFSFPNYNTKTVTYPGYTTDVYGEEVFIPSIGEAVSAYEEYK